jgi:ArsR family transcriptional regulator, lead/cadmium/zinc/bismuth-responsive transcriptional repressor
MPAMAINQDPPDMCACAEVDQARAQAARACLLDLQTARALAAIFAALSDPTRLRIVSMLGEREVCVGELVEILGVEQSAISHQLRDMRRQRLVRCRQDGRHVYYRLDDEHVRFLYAQGLAHVLHANAEPAPDTGRV